MRIFHNIAIGFFLVFMSVMTIATYVAFTHRSGITRIDMSKSHLLRTHVAEK